jgi:hypothetical protein
MTAWCRTAALHPQDGYTDVKVLASVTKRVMIALNVHSRPLSHSLISDFRLIMPFFIKH